MAAGTTLPIANQHCQVEDQATAMILTLPAHRDNRRLHQLILLAAAAGLIFLWINSPLEAFSLKVTGSAMFLLAFLPILRWAGQNRAWFPAFEVMLLTTAVFYAVPLLSGHPATLALPEEMLLKAGVAMLIYQGAAIIVFERLNRVSSPGTWFTDSLLSGRAAHYSQAGLWINTIYLYASYFTDWIPWELASIMRAVCFGVGLVSIFVQSSLYGQGELSIGEKLLFLLHLIAQCTFMLLGLFLIQVLGLIALGLAAYMAIKRRVPFVPIIVLLPILAILHTGKPAMRAIYWEEDAARPGFTEIPAFFSQWVQLAFDTKANADAEASMGARFAERASLFHILGYVVTRIPEYDPYLGGETYWDIPAQIVPRILWPGKPTPHLSNIRLAIYFGFVTEESASRVSIAFGIPAEAYANFGFLGMALIGGVLGFVYKAASLLSMYRPIFSAAGLTMIILTAWSFQAELVLATWFSSLFQAGIVVVIVPLVARQLGFIGK